jgi:hypothetical protein
MRDRATALAVALGMALAAAACSGGAEKNVVNQYFTAVRANDTNTLTSFAMVQFDKPIEDWKIVSVGAETRLPAPLPELVKKQKDLEAELAKNKSEAQKWGNDLSVYQKRQQLAEIQAKGGKVPPALVPIQQKYDAYQATDRDLKKKVAAAKNEVEREKRNATLSVGQVEGLEDLTGEMITKDVELLLTTGGGQKTSYLMTLRKYQLTGGTGPRMVSRWVVQSLVPKA